VVVVDELREWLRARPAEAAPEPQDDLDRRADEILEGLLS
jgi:hypothetical protein